MKTIRQTKRIYYVATFLVWLTVALPLPLMVLLAQARGFNLFQIGLAMGVYSLTIVLLEVPTGGLADAIGRKKVALIAYAVSMAATLIFLFAFSIPALMLAMILNGIGRALSSGALDAWFVDSLLEIDPDVEIQPALAQAGTVTLLALGIGTLAGGALPRLFSGLPADGSAVLTPISTTLVASLIVNFSLLLFIAVAVKETRSNADESYSLRTGLAQMPVIVRDAFALSRGNHTLVLLLGASMVGGLAISVVETFWQPFFGGLLGDPQGKTYLFGMIMAGSFLFGVGGNLLSVPLSRRLHKRYGLVAALSQGAQGLFLILLAMQSSVGVAAALFWLVYVSMSVTNSPHATLVNEQIPSARRSSMLSVQSLATYIGAFVGSTGLGYVAQQTSISVAWVVAGATAMVSLLLYLAVDRRNRSKEQTYTDADQILETN